MPYTHITHMGIENVSVGIEKELAGIYVTHMDIENVLAGVLISSVGENVVFQFKTGIQINKISYFNLTFHFL